MAEAADASGEISASVCLTEDGYEIPGAKRPKRSPEECKCWMLRRWLQCRGARARNYVFKNLWLRQMYTLITITIIQLQLDYGYSYQLHSRTDMLDQTERGKQPQSVNF